jgi:hypothetical protein
MARWFILALLQDRYNVNVMKRGARTVMSVLITTVVSDMSDINKRTCTVPFVMVVT